MIIVIFMVIGFIGQAVMIWPNAFTMGDPMIFATKTAAASEGAVLVALASHVHEQYGTEKFGLIFGSMLSFGVVGLYALDEVFIENIFDMFAEVNAAGVLSFKGYGEWNVIMFSVLTGAYFICVILSIVSFILIGQQDEKESHKLVMVKF